MPDLTSSRTTRTFPSVGKCIYCGSIKPPITDEHIIPQGLGGREYLPYATCEDCRLITSKFEEIVQRNMVWGLRRTLGMRGKRKPPPTIPAHGLIDGKPFSTHMAHEKIAVKGTLPVFGRAPGILLGEHYSDEPKIEHIIYVDQNHVGNFGKPGSSALFAPWAVIRLLAKIAHASLIGEIGLDAFDAFLPSIILGKMDGWNNFVGQAPIAPLPKDPNIGHRVELFSSTQPGYEGTLWARIRLFAQIGGPVYDVAIGRRRTQFPVQFHIPELSPSRHLHTARVLVELMRAKANLPA